MSGTWRLIRPFDQNDQDAAPYLENNSGRTGTPSRYDKRGSIIILDVTPDYASTAGLKVYFKRGASHFVYSDTTKVPGFASNFHPYIVNHASTNYALDRSMPQAKNWFELLGVEEKAIQSVYSIRSKDEKPKLKVLRQNNR